MEIGFSPKLLASRWAPSGATEIESFNLSQVWWNEFEKQKLAGNFSDDSILFSPIQSVLTFLLRSTTHKFLSRPVNFSSKSTLLFKLHSIISSAINWLSLIGSKLYLFSKQQLHNLVYFQSENVGHFLFIATRESNTARFANLLSAQNRNITVLLSNIKLLELKL